MEYRDQFELVTLGTMRNVDLEIVKGIFLNGLREELQTKLQLYEHESLAQLKKKGPSSRGPKLGFERWWGRPKGESWRKYI